jgi:TetR/AcrR family transcriptional regulator, transcriptional repressor for nem operon
MRLRTYPASDMRLRIVRAAGDLFHGRGLGSTTTDEIIKAAGIGKAEFHQHFRSKSELVCAVLRYYFEGLAAGIGPVKYELDSWDDLQECLRSHIEFQKRFKMTRSCPIGTLGNELKGGEEVNRQSLSHILDLMLARLESFFSREKVAGRLARDVDVEQLANFCVAIIQGAMLTGKIRGNVRSLESTFEDLLSHLKRYSLAPAAPRKRLGKNDGRKRLFTLANPPEPTTVVESYDSGNREDSPEDCAVDQCRLKVEAQDRRQQHQL